MHAVQFSAFGDTSQLATVELPGSLPGPGMLRVRQVASSINPVDLYIRRGTYPAVTDQMLPYVGGRDVSGVIDAVGDGIDRGWIGRRVLGAPDFTRGAFAEAIIMRPDELAEVPEGLSLRDAGMLPIAALTAYQGLFEQGGLKCGETVLIHGGTGGVGHYAVQMAARAGARVVATASARNRSFLCDLGADLCLAYDEAAFETEINGVDLVLDLIGGATQKRSWAVLRNGGRLISAVAQPDPVQAEARKASAARFFIAQPRPSDLATIARQVCDGAIHSHVAARFPMTQVPQAQALLEAGGIRGKVAVDIAPDL